TLTRNGGTVNLLGTLDNSGTTLTLDGAWNLAGGTIKGGHYTGSGAGRLVFTSSGGTLDGVTADSDLDLASNNGAGVHIVNGLVLNGTARLGNTTGTTYGRLYFDDTESLTGSGTVLFGKHGSN